MASVEQVTTSHPAGHYRWGVFSTIIITVTIIIYVVNTAVIMAFSATGDAGEKIRVMGEEDHGVEFRVTGGLQPSRVLHSNVSGYVNVADPAPVVYLDEEKYGAASNRHRTDLRNHETFHVMQKRLVASRSGGYPSKTNPVQTARYYRNLHDLNNILATAMPTPPRDLPFRSGLETSADCWMQFKAVTDPDRSTPLKILSSYLPGISCTAEQMTMVVGVEQGIWPGDDARIIMPENFTGKQSAPRHARKLMDWSPAAVAGMVGSGAPGATAAALMAQRSR